MIFFKRLKKIFHCGSLGIGTKAPFIRRFTITRGSLIIGAPRNDASLPLSSLFDSQPNDASCSFILQYAIFHFPLLSEIEKGSISILPEFWPWKIPENLVPSFDKRKLFAALGGFPFLSVT